MHEASLSERNCFLTLTYRDENLPHGRSLRKKDFQDFMKRLRKEYVYGYPDYTAVSDFVSGSVPRIRFFHCGEYGERTGRPHYHAIIFGFDFPDKRYLAQRHGYTVWRSSSLERLWSLGLCEIGTVTIESAAYVARYALKKVNGRLAADHYLRVNRETGELCDITPEYCTMSRRPGIGAAWFGEFGGEVYPSDGVLVRGRLVKPPRFYDNFLEAVSPEVLAAVKLERRRKASLVPVAERLPRRLRVKDDVLTAKVNLFARSERDG